MRHAIALFLVSATAALAQSPTYRDVIAAKRAGSNPPPCVVATEVIRRVVVSTASNATVVFLTPGGETRTDIVHYAVMYGAAQVQTQEAARVAERQALRKLTMAIATTAGTDTNTCMDETTDARNTRAALYTTATNVVGQANIPPGALAGAVAAALAAGVAAGRATKSTGVTTIPVDPSASADGTPAM